MPYVFDNENLEWLDDGDDAKPPKASEFVYMPPKEVGGANGPVKLAEVGADLDEEPQVSAALLEGLKALGVTKIYCRYDGGNDEGFAWFDHATLASGARLDLGKLAEHLRGGPLKSRFEKRQPWQAKMTDAAMVEEMLGFPLANTWAAALLGGRGYGTGEYSMYGAFVVDLLRGTITDDSTATVAVRNIEIDGVPRAESPTNSALNAFSAELEATAIDPSPYSMGDRVEHRNFGKGTVKGLDGRNLTIAFDDGQTRNLIDAFVSKV